jgi:hypothetical protein
VKRTFIVVAAAWMVCAPVLSSGHHGNASLDTDKSMMLTGVVTEYLWSNPHVFLKLDVKEANGEVRHWVVEAQNPIAQSNAGWSRGTFKAGDEVTIDIIPAKTTAPVGRFRGRIVINGEVFKP